MKEKEFNQVMAQYSEASEWPSSPGEVIQFYREKQKGESVMRRFWDALKESIVIQGLITVMVLGAIIYLVVTQQEVPDQLWQAFALILGFFFGSKVERAKK